MYDVKRSLVVIVLLSLCSGGLATAKRRRTEDVIPEACLNEGVRVSECRAAFITELEMMHSMNQNNQHTNCTLYSKLECCVVTEYGALGCGDKEVINKAISFAIKDHQSYDNCPKGLCDPASVNSSFKIMRDMDENLHGRDAVAGLVNVPKRKIKRDVHAAMEAQAPEVGSEANKDSSDEHTKVPKHKGKKKGHKKGHKGKKGKKPKLTADDILKYAVSPDYKGDASLEVVPARAHNNEERSATVHSIKAVDHAKENITPKATLSPDHKDNGSHEVVTAKAHNDEQGSATLVSINAAGTDKENMNAGKSVLESTNTDVSKKVKTSSVGASGSPAAPAEVAPANGAATSVSSLGKEALTGETGGHDALANVKIPISIEIVKNISLSDIGKTSKKTHRRRRLHRNKPSKRVLNFETTKGLPEVNKTHASEAASSNQSQVSSAAGESPLVHSEGILVDSVQPNVSGSNKEQLPLSASEAPVHDPAKLEMKGGASVDLASITSVNKSSPDDSHYSNSTLASGAAEKEYGKKGSSGELTADKSVASGTEVGNQTKDNRLLAEKHQDEELNAYTGSDRKKSEIASKEHGNETAVIEANRTAAAMGDGLLQDAKIFGKSNDTEKQTTKLVQEANLDKDIGTFAPLFETSGENGNLLYLPNSKVKLTNNAELLDTKLESNTTSESGVARSSASFSEKSFASDVAHENTSSTEKRKNTDAAGKPSSEEEPKNSKLSDVPEISLAVHRLERKHEISSDATSFAHESLEDRVRKTTKNQTKVSDNKGATENLSGTANASASHNQTIGNQTSEEELAAPAKKHVDNKTGALSEAAVNLKDPKQVFGSGPLIEVKGHKGGSVEKQMVHAYETGESGENIKGKNSFIDDLVDQYGSGGSDYDMKYGRDFKRRHRPRFRDDDTPKVRRNQWDGDEPFEVDTTRDPFQEYPSVKDGDPRTGGLYGGNHARRHSVEEENVRIARHKKVHRRKPDNDYNYESMVRWKLLEELDSILDSKNSPDVENMNKPSGSEFRHEKVDDMDQWKRRLQALKVQVQAQSGEHIVGGAGDSFRDADAMRDGEMYYRKYRRQGPLAYGQGYEGVQRPIVKDPLIHQAKKRFWIERQESYSNKSHFTEPRGATGIYLRPLPEAPGRELPPALERAERHPPNESMGLMREAVPYVAGHRLISSDSRASKSSGLGGRRYSSRRAARARRLRGSRASRKLNKNLKDTEGLKILRNDDLQGDDDDDDDEDPDDEDDEDDEEDEKEAAGIKKSTLPAVSAKGQVGHVDAAERPLMSFGERVHTMEPTRTTPKKEIKPAGNLVGSAESPDCVPDTLRAHTDYCRGIYTKHQLSIEEARKTASKKTMACYKLESIKGCLSAGSYFSKCVGANNNEFQELQGSVMSQMRDLRCGGSVLSGSTMLLVLAVALNYLLRGEN